MAEYKYSQYLIQGNNKAYDQLHSPGVLAPYSGIYRCAVCGHEDTCVSGKPLPPQNHHQHNPPAPIQWKLIVAHAHIAD
jgi:hypothetical protein